jgi:hypothetical protein
MSKRSNDQAHVENVSKKLNSNDTRGNKIFSSISLGRNEEYEGSFPVYKQPQEVNSYSIDHERKVWFDNREMVSDRFLSILAYN